MSTHIYIIRHAEVEYPYDARGRKLMYLPETHISKFGRIQISKFAFQLKEKGIVFDCIETSPFIRAVETAEIISNVLGRSIVVKNTIFSDSHVPGWIGVPLIEQQKLMNRGSDIYQNPRSEDQEPYESIAKRMLFGFKDLAKRYEDKTVAMISHGDPIRLLMYRLSHPDGDIPNMSILSKENYLKRGEAFHTVVNDEGCLIYSELIVGRDGPQGKREIYN